MQGSGIEGDGRRSVEIIDNDTKWLIASSDIRERFP